MERDFPIPAGLESSASSDARPTVSVIMPVYNGATTLQEAIDSVLAQTFQDFEFIIVDDASTDHSVQIIQSYGSRIQLIRRTSNSGNCGIPRNDARKIARGRYWAYLDQDDTWEPAKLKQQIAFMEQHPEYPLVHTYSWVLDEHGNRLHIRHDEQIPPSGPCAEQLLKHCFVTFSSVITRRDMKMDSRYPTPPPASNSDLLYLFAILQHAPAGFGFIPEPLCSYRKWSGNMSRQWKWGKTDVVGLNLLYRSGLWRGLVPHATIRHAIRSAYLSNAETHRHLKEYSRSQYFILQGILRFPLFFPFYTSLLKGILQQIHSSISTKSTVAS